MTRHRRVRSLLVSGFLWGSLALAAAEEAEVPGIASYLPADADHDPEAPTPEGVLGWPFGKWHLHHHELIDYLRALDEWSDRVTLNEYARSHGRRPLVMLTVTSPKNHADLEAIRQGHLDRIARASEVEESTEKADEAGKAPSAPSRTPASAEAGDAPLVLWMGYGIHGNEPSASQAAVLLAYHLAAARSPEVQRLLDSAVVLIDPSLNPDGMERFAAWTNGHRGRTPSPHRGDREHIEDWPGGRSNYYWFDLNRDWLPAVHPESRGRLELFHRWMPHVLTDYHEMGNANRTYFFQPGIPEMTHPLTPERNQRLTADLARYHAKALDAVGSLYYTRESFDDFYIGKGSAYPDLFGSIGILYEQAGTRGFHHDTDHGRLTFPDTVRNQVATSLSTLKGADEMRRELIDHQLSFQREAIEAAEASGTAAHIVAAPGDPQRLEAFRVLLERHGIRCAVPSEAVEADGLGFPAGASLVVPSRQPRYHLLTAMMEKRTRFGSPLFYDVSAWHLPSAYGLLHAELEALPPLREDAPQPPPAVELEGPQDAVAYLVPWEPLNAPAALWRLFRERVRTWVAQRPLVVGGEGGKASYPHGTLVVPATVQEHHDADSLHRLMEEIAREHAIPIRAVDTALGAGGLDLGSPSLKPLRSPEVLLVAGPGTSSTTVGTLWHQFDLEWEAPLTLADPARLTAPLLRDFNTLILADAPFSNLPAAAREAIEAWVARGGCLVAIGSSAASVAPLKWVGAKTVKADFGDEAKPKDGKGKAEKKAPAPPSETPYDEAERRRAERRINGMVARAWFDPTHPLAYGYSQHGPHIALMHVGTTFLEASPNPLRNPLRHTDDPLVSGYIAGPNLEALKGSVPVQLHSHGSGRVVLLVDNPVFRGHWLGSAKLLANAVFFSPVASVSGPGEEDEASEETGD